MSRRITSRPLTSGLAFGFFSLAFLTRGIIGRYFPNSGADDGHGQVGYYLLFFASYAFWTISSIFLLNLVLIAGDGTIIEEYRCGRHEYRICLGLMVFCFVLMSMACVWNALTLWNASDLSVDDHNQDATANNLPMWLLSATTLTWNILFCAFIIASVYFWTQLARQRDYNVMVGKFSHSVAAFAIVFLQLVNAMVVLLLTLYSVCNYKKMLDDKTATSVASVVFNFCTLVTGWLIYDYILALFPPLSRNTEKMVDTDSEDDEPAVDINVVSMDDDLDNATVVLIRESIENDEEDPEQVHSDCVHQEKQYENTSDGIFDEWTIMTKRALDAFTNMFSFTTQVAGSQSMCAEEDGITSADGTVGGASETPSEDLPTSDRNTLAEC
jgi:hypothetical protein